jgi:thiol-disulfide isomerase/thioredoxin
LRAEQAKYFAISNDDIDGNPSIKLSDGLANMSDGEQILRKITEPYRGRLVLLDVWGTWCAPCKELLSKSAEEYERLTGWIRENLTNQGIEKDRIEQAQSMVLALCKETEEKSGKNKVYGECVLRFLDTPEIIIKDNGELFHPDIEDEGYSYNVLMARNRSLIRLSASGTAQP